MDETRFCVLLIGETQVGLATPVVKVEPGFDVLFNHAYFHAPSLLEAQGVKAKSRTDVFNYVKTATYVIQLPDGTAHPGYRFVRCGPMYMAALGTPHVMVEHALLFDGKVVKETDS